MAPRPLNTALVRRLIQDSDRVFLAPDKPYGLTVQDHKACWPKIVAALKKAGDKGLYYATVKAMSGSNKDFAAYLIGDREVLRCPALESRLSLPPSVLSREA
jgi:hypothetical protein